MKLKIKLNVSKNNNFESSFTRRFRHSTVETKKYNSLGLSPSRKEELRMGIYQYLLTRFLPAYAGWEFTYGRFDSGAQCWSKVMTLWGGGGTRLTSFDSSNAEHELVRPNFNHG